MLDTQQLGESVGHVSVQPSYLIRHLDPLISAIGEKRELRLARKEQLTSFFCVGKLQLTFHIDGGKEIL